ncbi:hypothetical protein F5887DRAFT_995172 [Amanita rubescens]|nr:hypothetical protein F5887DRAFT_995172 [Amanita rubescens]
MYLVYICGGVYFIKGPKKTGKSTFARTLLDRLLVRFDRVAYLECDPGQSEFTPGGMVALNIIEDHCFGPPFSHPTSPNRAHYIGATTPLSSPAHYLASVQALFQAYELDLRTPLLSSDVPNHIRDVIPLLVNTMGWNKGIGADLTQRIQDIIQPTHVFEITASNSLDDFNYPPDFGKSQLYAQIEPIVPSSVAPLHTLYTPADDRVINLLSHLHAVFPAPSREIVDLSSSTTSLEQITATSWRTALPLCSQVPYAVDWRVAPDRIISRRKWRRGCDSRGGGALVGLVSSWEDGVNANGNVAIMDSGLPPTRQTLLPCVQGARPPTPTSSTCFGIALVRSFSETKSS